MRMKQLLENDFIYKRKVLMIHGGAQWLPNDKVFEDKIKQTRGKSINSDLDKSQIGNAKK